MARRVQTGDPELLRRRLVGLLNDFKRHLIESDLREQVKSLVPAVHVPCDLGASLVPGERLALCAV